MKAILIGVASVLAVSVAVAMPASVGVAVRASSCSPSVGGSTPGEQAAVRRILCRMRGTAIEGVQILGSVPDARPDALWLAISVPKPTRSPGDILTYDRAKWEANIAAGAVRDDFDRLGYPKVVGYQELPAGAQPDPHALFGIALRAWDIPRWATGGRPNPPGGHVETWAELQTKLSALSRRFGVRTRLERYAPFGKAPLVTVLTSQPTRFIDAGGFAAYKRALHFGSAYYDGVLLRLLTPQLTGIEVDAVFRGRSGTSGCAWVGHIKHSSKVCQGS